MNTRFLLISVSAIAWAISSDLSHLDYQQPDPEALAINSSALSRQSNPYKVTFTVPAHTRIEGDLELAIQNNNAPDTLMVPAEIQVYNSFTKHTMTVSLCLPHKTMAQKSTFEIGESPRPKQVIVTFSRLPGQSDCASPKLPDSLQVRVARHRYKGVSTCSLVGLPEKRLLTIPSTHKYVETSVQAQCTGGSASNKPSVPSSMKVTVRFRKHPLD